MSPIHSIEEKQLQHIAYLYYQTNASFKPWLLTCKKWCKIARKVHFNYTLFFHTDRYDRARWHYMHLPSQRLFWINELNYHRWQAKDRVFQLTIETLFGGREAYLNIPYLAPVCTNLMLQRIDENTLTQPIMRGHDREMRDFISVRFPVADGNTIKNVHYLFIRSPYWRVHYCCGDRALLGKVGQAMAFLIRTHSFNKLVFPLCKKAILSIMRGDRIIPRHLV